MSLKVGIVGLPNVGKSTLFNALLQKQTALAANYPFATIEPNVGVVPVPDSRLPVLAEIVHTKKIVPATVEFFDIAGLVAGASQGAGLGNKFLSHIRETQLIVHVVRAFLDEGIIREGSSDPKNDYETISTELQLADLQTLEKQSAPKGNMVTPETQERWRIIQMWKEALNRGESLRHHLENEVAELLAKELALLTAKPEMVALNVSEEQLANSESLIVEYAPLFNKPVSECVVICAKLENELAGLDDSEKQEYLETLGIPELGLERLIRQAYQTLGLKSFYTAGELEARAWTIHTGSTAPEAAGEIHTDFTKHFIKAMVMSFDDFVTYKGWKAAKEVGKVRQEGRDYVMRPDDVVEFAIGK